MLRAGAPLVGKFPAACHSPGAARGRFFSRCPLGLSKDAGIPDRPVPVKPKTAITEYACIKLDAMKTRPAVWNSWRPLPKCRTRRRPSAGPYDAGDRQVGRQGQAERSSRSSTSASATPRDASGTAQCWSTATPWSRFTPSAARAGCTPRALQCKSVARLFRRALARDAGRARMAPYILPELV
jgi:hypothetical protein